MQETRRARLQAVILEELSTVVPREVKDPRVPPVTFTSVEVSSDGSHATVLFSLFGSLVQSTEGEPDPAAEAAQRKKAAECAEGLNRASGFLRKHLARVLTVRHIPTLAFKEDRGFENTVKVHELLKKISSEKTGA